MLLKVNNLVKKFDNKIAVNNVSFEVSENSILCILGPSGCGKTTILNMIGGFIKPTEGQIILNGEDITNSKPEERNTSTVFQTYGLFYHMNVIENVSYGLKFKKLPKDEIRRRALEMIEMVGLAGNENKMMSELSGGMRQRVALARSLVISPGLLLLDEPLSNLDQKLRVSMRSLIRDLVHRLNISTIFVTHDQNEAFELADNIILMDNGKIIQQGSAKEIYTSPINDFAQSFIGDHNIIDGVSVRPEEILITEGTPNAIIKDVIFQGSIIKLIMEYNNQEIESIILNKGIIPNKGDEVHISY